jgi:hypothetical protein
VHGSTGGATGAGFGLLYFDWRTCARRTLGFRAWRGNRSDGKKFVLIFF